MSLFRLFFLFTNDAGFFEIKHFRELKIKMPDSLPVETESMEDVYFDSSEEPTKNDLQLSPFESLPIELFLHICSFLDVRDMVLTLSQVCRRFHEILSDEHIWKSWISKRWNCRYPMIPLDDENFDWRGACFDIEREWKLWKTKDETVNYVNIDDVHISSVDAVVFLNSGSVCVSGSRDRSLVIWFPLKLNNKRPKSIQKNVAHEGWIWRLQYVNDTLYSCSWDNMIKSWTVENDDLQLKSSFRCGSPVLSMTAVDGLILGGDFNKTVYAFDPRRKVEPVFNYVAHRGPILTLGANDKDIISGSEDRSLVIWDMRSLGVRQKIQLGDNCYPNCSFVDQGNLIVGDNKGSIHVFKSTNEITNLISTFNMEHQKPISVVKGGRGYLMTGSLDGVVKIALPTNPPCVITSLKSNGGEVGGLDYCEGILATGRTNSVEFWIPKDHSYYTV